MKFQVKEKDFLQKYSPALLVVLIIAYVVLFSTVAFLKYQSFSFHDMDLSVINQTFWNTIRGNIIVQDIGSATILNGGHVFLIAIVLSPIYFMAQSPITLLFLQSVALGMGAWPIFLIAREHLKPLGGLVLAFCYLIYPALNYANLFEFHPIAFSTPFLLFMLLFYIRRKWWLFLLFMVLSLSCREDVSIPVFAVGVFGLIQFCRSPRGERRTELKWGLVPLLSGLIWFIFCVTFLQPHFRLPELQTATGESGQLAFYSWLGDSPGEILHTLFLQPGKVLRGILIKPKLEYLKDLFLPVAFFPVFSPSGLLMVLISLSEALLSQRFTHFSIHYQYSSIITPFIFVSAIYGARNVLRWKVLVGKEKFVLAVILLFSLISARTIGPLFILPSGIKQWRVTQEDKIRRKLVDQIPSRAPVIATFEFTPRLSMRPLLFYFYHVYFVSRRPDVIPRVHAAQAACQWALIDFNDYLTFYDFYTPGGDRDIYLFLNEGKWQLVDTVNSIALFRKGDEADIGLVGKADLREVEHALNIVRIPEIKLCGYNLSRSELLGERVIELNVYFRCLGEIPADFLLNARFTSNRDPDFSFQQPFFAPYRIYPTSRWRPGEVEKQRCAILIPGGAPSGGYTMTLALLVQKGAGFEGRFIYREPEAFFLP